MALQLQLDQGIEANVNVGVFGLQGRLHVYLKQLYEDAVLDIPFGI